MPLNLGVSTVLTAGWWGAHMEKLRFSGFGNPPSKAGNAWVLKRVEESQVGRARGESPNVCLRLSDPRTTHGKQQLSQRPKVWTKTRLATLSMKRGQRQEALVESVRTFAGRMGGGRRTSCSWGFSVGLIAVHGTHSRDGARGELEKISWEPTNSENSRRISEEKERKDS